MSQSIIFRMEFRVERVSASRLVNLRRKILRKNDPSAIVTNPLDDEEDTYHFAGLVNDEVVATSSFYVSPSPINPTLKSYQLRYMAVDFDVQGKGYGKAVLLKAEDELRQAGVEQLWAQGRDTALGFYSTLGWLKIDGSEHLSKETQLPHTTIYKKLV